MIIDNTILAYIAGIVDGEGSICIYKHNNSPRKFGQMKAVISNTRLDLLEFVRLYFGGTIYLTNQHKKHLNNKPAYQWVVASQKALRFLRAIEPFLRLKKMQAQIAIEYQGQRRNRGGHTCVLGEGERAIAEAQMIIMGTLNKKGGG